MRAVPDAPKAPVLPALSSARNCTRVSPSAVTTTLAPAVALDQVVPPSTEVRCSCDATPESVSPAPLADRVMLATLCQAGEPPLAVGAVGSVRSMRAVEPAVAEEGVQADVLPAPSMLRYCTSVSPSAVMFTLEPVAGALQVVPPSSEVRCS